MDLDRKEKNEDRGSDQIRIPIRRRVLIIVLLITLASLIAASVAGIICINVIRASSEAALTEQLQSNLKSIVQQKAASTDAKLEHYEKYIQLSTDYIEKLYKDPDKAIAEGYIFDAPRNTRDFVLSRGFTDETKNVDDLRDELLLFSNVEALWEHVAKENDGLITTIYAGTKRGLLTSYDKWAYLSAVPVGKELYYNYKEADWYKKGMKEKGVYYTGLYVDSQGRGLTITVASSFRDRNGKIQGVNAADFDITGLYDEMLSFDLGEGTFSFTLDRDGSPISPDAESKSVEEITGLTDDQIQKLLRESDGIMHTEDSIYVSIPIDRVGWRLCACVPTTLIQGSIREANRSVRHTMIFFIAVAMFIIILAVIAASRSASSITYPMELLGQDMKTIADGDLKHRASVYRNDEIGDMTIRLNELVDRLMLTMDDLIAARQKADEMSMLATRDSLTGIRNKTSYEFEAAKIDQEIAEGKHEFGLVMIDMNNLKQINDNYGHNNGDIAIKRLSKAICDIFDHSPVFRIGGDEFVVLLKGEDFSNVETLTKQFESLVEREAKDDTLDPWRRVSAALGFALFDPAQDENMRSVFERADKEMYRQKRTMEMLGEL